MPNDPKWSDVNWAESAAEIAERAILPRSAPVNQILSISAAVVVLIALVIIAMVLR